MSCSCRGEMACLFLDRTFIRLVEFVWTSGCLDCSMVERIRLEERIRLMSK